MKHLIALFALTALVLFAGTASAQDLGPCKEAAATHCSGISPGKGKVARCLKKHIDDLGMRCKLHLKGAKDNMTAACQPDYAALCEGKGGLKACLRNNKEKISEGCKASIKKLP